MPGNPSPCVYRYHDKQTAPHNMPIVLLTRHDGAITRTGGVHYGVTLPKLIDESGTIRINFCAVSMCARHGDSGGTVVDTKGAIVGIVAAKPVGTQYISCLVSWFDIMSFVSRYAHPRI
jgi:hypothetical protein